jgi:hypothetical protein
MGDFVCPIEIAAKRIDAYLYGLSVQNFLRPFLFPKEEEKNGGRAVSRTG